MPTLKTLLAFLENAQPRDLVPGLLEIKDMHRPWDGPILLGLDLPEDPDKPSTPAALHSPNASAEEFVCRV